VKESERICDQLNRSLDGQAWHGPALFELLKDVTAERAASRPVPHAHTIWEILLHVTVWVEQIRARLRGDDNRKDIPPHEDWPPQPDYPDDTAWKSLWSRLKVAQEALAADLAGLEDTRLDQPVLDGFSSTYATLHGLVQHNLYHAGQIALLKKAL
jgi:uncharacterized damage-inducible protein DinB